MPQDDSSNIKFLGGSEVVQQIRWFKKFKCLLFMQIKNNECFVYIQFPLSSKYSYNKINCKENKQQGWFCNVK